MPLYDIRQHVVTSVVDRQARRMSTNNPGLFHLVTPTVSPQATTGRNTYTHPKWDYNVWDATPAFNTFWYTEP
jgi:hypothetical protein